MESAPVFSIIWARWLSTVLTDSEIGDNIFAWMAREDEIHDLALAKS